VLRKPYREPVRERDPTGPATVYGMTKLLSEEILQRFTHEFGLESFILRISSPIPAEFDDLPRTVVRNWLEAARKGCDLHVNGTGQRSQDFVSCDDIARAVSCSLKTQLGHGLFHIGSGQPVTMLTLARLISGFRNSEIVMVGSDPNEGDRFVLSLDAATRDLGFEPRTTGLEAISRLASAIL
jgi:UDP-glucose 4-epimerase